MQNSPAQPQTEEELVRAHLPLVAHIVRETAAGLPAHVDRSELSSAGMTALTKAARSYNPETGVIFSRWAALKIRGALIDEMRSHDWASRSVRTRLRHRESVADQLTVTLGRMPTQSELAGELGISVAELSADESDVHRAVVLSLSAPLPGGGDTADLVPADVRTPEETLMERERGRAINDAVDCLPERLRAVVVGYYLENRPMAELAMELRVSESRISQMRAEAITLLRSGLKNDLDGLSVGPAKAGFEKREATYLATLSARHAGAVAAFIPAQRRALSPVPVRSAI